MIRLIASTFIVIFSFLLFAPVFTAASVPTAYAQTDTNDPTADFKKETDLDTPEGAWGKLGSLISVLISLSIIVGALLAFVFLVIGAYQYISAQGGDGATKGRQTMLFAGIGLVMLGAIYLVIIVFNAILPTASTMAATDLASIQSDKLTLATAIAFKEIL